MSIAVRPIHHDFVAEISGIDLAEPLKTADRDAIEDAINRYAVVVFRGQKLNDDQQIAFARHFGPIHSSAQKARHTGIKHRLASNEIADISNLDGDSNILEQNSKRRLDWLANRLWHTDASFRAVPGALSMLYAHVVPDEGGDTQFADMRAAYDALDEETRTSIEELRVYHSIVYSRHVLGFDFNEDERDKLKGAVHPLVRTIPGSGRRALYLASHAAHVVDWQVPEGRLLLRDLIDHATQPQFIYRHVWRPHDFVIWDNRCTMHRARPFDDKAHRRELRRTTTLDLPLPASA
jgi:alpha-ketoglutarate-dependent 2,4-dichlorophenoxyacetate dioxygenase